MNYPARFLKATHNTMKKIITSSALAVGLALCLPFALTARAELDTAKIDKITGLKGKMNQAEGVYKVTFPRDDVKVSVTGWQMPPFMGLGTWAAFQGTNDKAMMMGDVVLFQDEVNPVMTAALDNGLSVTALHNHFFFDEPKAYFMHIGGGGDLDKLAGGVRKIFDTIKAIRTANPQPATRFGGEPLPAESSITGKTIEGILGKGQTNNGMFKVVIGRKTVMPCGCEMSKDMGVNTWAAFAGADDNALVDGDFAVEEDQLQTALKSLRRNGINIVAIHSHMTHEQPRILFFHYWGRGPAKKLAEAIQDALLASGLSGVSTEAQK